MTLESPSLLTACPSSTPKWAALINDRLVPMPRRQVSASVIRDQAGVSPDQTLVRDHNSPHDPLIASDAMVDLAEGNVFNSIAACDAASRPPCTTPAKLAFFINDSWEVVIRGEQTGRTLRDLFGLKADVDLLRDFESPTDVPVRPDDPARFEDGPVFRTRHAASTLKIFVNGIAFTQAQGVQPRMSGRQIAALVGQEPASAEITREGSTTLIGGDDIVAIADCDRFLVTRKEVNAGFEMSRVDRELDELRKSGYRVTFVPGPVPSVVYHDLPIRSGHPFAATDVLVVVPSVYPGEMIDNAFLPKDSPLLSLLVGSPQPDKVITALGREWVQKSLHPHTHPENLWDHIKHGFHTYWGELLAWVNKRA